MSNGVLEPMHMEPKLLRMCSYLAINVPPRLQVCYLLLITLPAVATSGGIQYGLLRIALMWLVVTGEPEVQRHLQKRSQQ